MRRLATLTLAMAMACGSTDSTAPVSVVIVGSYKLTMLNGSPPPGVVINNATQKLELLDDMYTLLANHTYTEVAQYRTTRPDGTVTTTVGNDAGSYTTASDVVQLVSTLGNGTTSARITNTALNVAATGFVAQYARQ